MVAHDGFYNDQFHFAGRLQSALHEIDSDVELKAWLNENPDDYVVVYPKNQKRLDGIEAKAAQSYLDGMAALLDAPSALNYLGRNGR